MSERKGKASTRAKNKYNAVKYDNLRIVIPKGRKADVEVHAESRGLSVNGLVNELLRKELNIAELEWKKGENEP